MTKGKLKIGKSTTEIRNSPTSLAGDPKKSLFHAGRLGGEAWSYRYKYGRSGRRPCSLGRCYSWRRRQLDLRPPIFNQSITNILSSIVSATGHFPDCTEPQLPLDEFRDVPRCSLNMSLILSFPQDAHINLSRPELVAQKESMPARGLVSTNNDLIMLSRPSR